MVEFIEIFDNYLVPFGLAAIMFGLGLSLSIEDFRRVLTFPKAVVTGTFGQLFLLPAATLLATLVLPMPPAVAIGLIALAGAPGGVSSNAFVFAVRGDVALSVTLTAISSTVIAFSLPFILWVGLQLHAGGGAVPDLPLLKIMQQLLIITVLPVLVGMIIHAYRPAFALRTAVFFRPASLIFLGVLIAVTVFVNFDALAANLMAAAGYALLLNIAMMAAGYGLARATALNGAQTITIAYEVGIQNAGIAILVTRVLMDAPDYSIAAIMYGVLMMVTAFLGAPVCRRLLAR